MFHNSESNKRSVIDREGIMVEIDVVGRHALLFDDDAAAEFVNSKNALVDWNSLLIDRYDVRHLLPSPPPPRRRRHQQKPLSPPSLSSIESELDYERYLDLPSPSDEQESDENMKPAASGGYAAVPFSYGNTEDPNDQKNANPGLECGGFQPPFPVPDSLFQNIPPTEKLHQIIARTALFVSKHGGQSEIVLRVKQGDNPTFGFLMPDHRLHPYFRFLVDNQEHLLSKDEGKPEHEEKVFNADHGAGVGALSLLGSLYGTGEEEDAAGAAEIASTSKENVPGETSDNNKQQQQQSLNPNHLGSGETSDVKAKISLGANKTVSPKNITVQEEGLSKPSLPSKEKVSAWRRNSFTSAIKVGVTAGTRKGELSSLAPAPEKMRASSLPPLPKTERLLLEPPSELKRLVDKIVEFILKNGKQFEAVLLEQDCEHGRFPFLMPSNQYHPYYLQVLHKAQESKSRAKSFITVKDAPDKKISKESETVSLDSAGCDIPYDSSDRKEKFKMVLGKSKKDGPDPSSKATHQQLEVRVDAAQVAAILQAATRGMKYPDFGILSISSMNGNNYPHGADGSLQSSQPESSTLPGVKSVAKTAAIETTSEADSSESHLTKEQKLKAERLKRAKMFTAMLKNGSASSLTEPSRGLSAERQDSGASGFDSKVNVVGKDREGSSAPIDVDSSDKNGKPDQKHSDNEFNERKSRRKYRLRSSGHEGDKAEEDDDEDDGGEDEKRAHKHTRKKPRDAAVKGDKGGEAEDEATNKGRRKKHRSHHSSSEDDNEERDYKYLRKKHRSHRSLLEDATEEETDDERYDKYSRKKHRRSYDDDKEQDEEHERDYRKKCRSYRSSYEDDKHEDEDDRVHRYSRNKHSSHGDDEEEEKDHRHSRKKHRSHRSSHHSRDRHKHRKDHSSRHRHKYESSDEEHRHHDRGDKHTKESHTTKEELEEGEISPKFSDQSKGAVTAGTGAVAGFSASREASVDISCTNQEQRGSSQPSDTSGVPDDLRAKIRAMLMSTM